MSWFITSLIAPFIWSILNHLDKFLISKYSRDTGVAGLSIFSSLFAIFALPVIYFFDKDVFSVSIVSSIALVISGIFMVLTVFFYLHALERDDASHVVPFWFLSPVIAYVLGILFLGEFIEGNKILGSIITLIGALILSLEFDEGIKVKKITTILMVSSSLSLALGDIIFKYFVYNTSFWQAIFWNQVGFVIFGLVLLLIKKYRKDFIKVCKMGGVDIVSVNILGEIGQTTAIIINSYALIMAPVALVLLVNYTFQPLFVFAGGIFMSKFFSHIYRENLSNKHLIQKIASIAIMAIGVYLVMV